MEANIKDYYSTAETNEELKLLSMISGTWVSRLIYFSIKSRLLEYIVEGKNTVTKLCSALNCDHDILERYLKGLEHINILKCDPLIQLTTLGQRLLPDVTGSLHAMALLWGEEFYYAWDKILSPLLNATSGFEQHYGKNLFQYLEKNPQTAKNFDRAMTSLANLLYPAVVAKLPLTNVKHIVDVGGGNGFFIKQILNQHPHLTGTLFERCDVIQRAKASNDDLISPRNLYYAIGDFFKNVPAADAHVLANILHDWNDEDALTILKNVRNAQYLNSKLFIIEMLVDHPDEPMLARSTDLNMLMLTGGKERSYKNFSHLLTQAKFKIESVINVKEMVCLIHARAV